MVEKSSQEKLLSLQLELEQIYLKLEAIREESALLGKYELEYTVTKTTIENLKKISLNEESLVPIGGGVYLKTKILDNEKVLMNVGAGVYIETNIDDVIEKIDKALESIQKRRKELTELSLKLSKKAEEIRNEIVKLTQSSSKG